MKLYAINAGNFKLDGGAMHGVVPKSLWQRFNPADENNLCNWAMRCLLIDTGSKRILIDNGIGDKQNEKFFSHYHLNGDDSIQKNLDKYGYSVDDITDNWLSHLHFDHCGGGIVWNKDRTGFEPLFKNASFYVNEEHWEHALNPNPREKASFLKDNLLPMKESGHLKFLDSGSELGEGIDFLTVNGHTESMMLPKITINGKTVLFMADLCASVAHLPLAWVMSYDIRPLDTMSEREKILNQACDEGWILFFEHDAVNECCTLKRTEKGIRVDETFLLSDVSF